MQRTSSLKRYTELKQKTSLKRGWWNPKRKTEPKALRDARVVVKLRSNGFCEIRYEPVCTGKATEMHHIQPRGRGGKHDSMNLAASCHPCHRWVTDNPWEAAQLGWLKTGHTEIKAKVDVER